jgi:hypothetical protein
MHSVLRWIPVRPDSGESRIRFGVRLLVAVLCAAALLQAMRPAVYSTRQGVQVVSHLSPTDPARLEREQLEYLGTELHRQIPAGTRARIVDSDQQWRYRLIELSTQWGIVAVDTGAQVEVRLQFDPAAPHGVRLLIQKVGE